MSQQRAQLALIQVRLQECQVQLQMLRLKLSQLQDSERQEAALGVENRRTFRESRYQATLAALQDEHRNLAVWIREDSFQRVKERYEDVQLREREKLEYQEQRQKERAEDLEQREKERTACKAERNRERAERERERAAYKAERDRERATDKAEWMEFFREMREVLERSRDENNNKL